MMNDSYTNDSVVIHTKNMLMDYGETFNETNSEFVSDSVNNTTLSESEDYDVKTYLESILGPQRQPSEKLIPLTIIYVAMAITGIIGNVSVCWVILRIPYMRSATNYYLFSLAVSDLLILLLGLPNDLHVFWQQYPWILGEALCKIRALISEMTSNSSVLTIVAFSLERYLAICHPYYSYTMSGLHRASKIIATVWLLALITAIPYAVCTEVLLQYHPITQEKIPESAFCTVNPMKTPSYLFESTFILFFLIPMCIMIILYIRMGFTIHNQQSNRNAAALGRQTSSYHRGQRSTSGDIRPTQSKKAILKMLAAVVIAFFVCWAPFHTQRLMYIAYYDYGWKFVNEATYHHINEKLYYVTGCFYYFSSTVNPILYNLLSVKYRNAFKEALCGVRNRDDLATYRSSMHGIHSTLSTNVSRSLRGQNNLSRNGTNQHKSNGQISPPDRPKANNGNLLSIETIELGSHSSTPSISDPEAKRRVQFHGCMFPQNSCDTKSGTCSHDEMERNCLSEENE